MYDRIRKNHGKYQNLVRKKNGFSISENKSTICTSTRKRTQFPSSIKLGPYQFPHKEHNEVYRHLFRQKNFYGRTKSSKLLRKRKTP